MPCLWGHRAPPHNVWIIQALAGMSEGNAYVWMEPALADKSEGNI